MDATGICLYFLDLWIARCGRPRCGPGWCRTRENSLSLRDFEFWMVWTGRGFMRSRDREFVIAPGFAALMRPGGIYDAIHDVSDHPLGIIYLHFDVVSPAAGQETLRQAPEFYEVSDPDFYDAMSQRILKWLPEDEKVAGRLLEALIEDLLRQPLRQNRQASGSTRQAEISGLVSWLRTASPEELPTVSELAARLHVSVEHFSRLFRAATGRSPMDFLLERRMAHARHLLRESPLAIGEIADRLGYRDVYFFSRQFKEKTGRSPTAFRAGDNPARPR